MHFIHTSYMGLLKKNVLLFIKMMSFLVRISNLIVIGKYIG